MRHLRALGCLQNEPGRATPDQSYQCAAYACVPAPFFPASSPRSPPDAVVFTRWLSITPAVGAGARPAFWRTVRRTTSLTRSQVPSLVHVSTEERTLVQGGKSEGIMRQWQPVRSQEHNAVTIAQIALDWPAHRARSPHKWLQDCPCCISQSCILAFSSHRWLCQPVCAVLPRSCLA